jgi:hypothetical protein
MPVVEVFRFGFEAVHIDQVVVGQQQDAFRVDSGPEAGRKRAGDFVFRPRGETEVAVVFEAALPAVDVGRTLVVDGDSGVAPRRVPPGMPARVATGTAAPGVHVDRTVKRMIPEQAETIVGVVHIVHAELLHDSRTRRLPIRRTFLHAQKGESAFAG